MSEVGVKLEGGGMLQPPPPFCDPSGGTNKCCNKDTNPSIDDEEDIELNAKGKLKSTCERCSVAKVKCSGSMPCTRCIKKGLDCEYKMEKKRGRRTVGKKAKEACSDQSCWGQVIMNPISKSEDIGAKFGLESVERRLFQVFFSIYKHHATPQSCCREWFTYQLNKMSTFLLHNGNSLGQEKLDAWMMKKGIQITRRNPADYRKIPANVIDEVSGRKLPPIHPLKGPKLLVSEPGANIKRKRTKVGAQIFSTKGFYNADIKNSPVDREIESMKKDMCFINLRSTHESFEVEVNDAFTSLFGYTTQSIVSVLERLFGGLLPWGSDVLGILLSHDNDLLFFMRTLALHFNQIGRPPQFPATRQVFSSHIFEFDTKSGDIVECLMKTVHREYLSLDRTEVDIYIGLEPMFPDVPRLFDSSNYNGEKKRLVSHPGQNYDLEFPVPQQQQMRVPPPPQLSSNVKYEAPVIRPLVAQQFGGGSIAAAPSNELEGVDFLDNIMSWTDDSTAPDNYGAGYYIPQQPVPAPQVSVQMNVPQQQPHLLSVQQGIQHMQVQQQMQQQQQGQVPPKRACALDLLPPQ